MPSEIEEYVHRIGRTGRVGNDGQGIFGYFGRLKPLKNLLDKLKSLKQIKTIFGNDGQVIFSFFAGLKHFFLTQAVSFWDWAEDVKIQKDLVRILKTSGELDVKSLREQNKG